MNIAANVLSHVVLLFTLLCRLVAMPVLSLNSFRIYAVTGVWIALQLYVRSCVVLDPRETYKPVNSAGLSCTSDLGNYGPQITRRLQDSKMIFQEIQAGDICVCMQDDCNDKLLMLTMKPTSGAAALFYQASRIVMAAVLFPLALQTIYRLD